MTHYRQIRNGASDGSSESFLPQNMACLGMGFYPGCLRRFMAEQPESADEVEPRDFLSGGMSQPGFEKPAGRDPAAVSQADDGGRKAGLYRAG